MDMDKASSASEYHNLVHTLMLIYLACYQGEVTEFQVLDVLVQDLLSFVVAGSVCCGINHLILLSIVVFEDDMWSSVCLPTAPGKHLNVCKYSTGILVLRA